MAEVHASRQRTIPAAPEHVYRVLTDFTTLHPRILPANFSDLRVEEGGTGAGTILSYHLKAGGRSRDYRVRIDEPEPGRVMTETDLTSSIVTTFTVTPVGTGCEVRIDTRWQGAAGFGGVMERLFAPRVLSRLYADELERLETVAGEAASERA